MDQRSGPARDGGAAVVLRTTSRAGMLTRGAGLRSRRFSSKSNARLTLAVPSSESSWLIVVNAGTE